MNLEFKKNNKIHRILYEVWLFSRNNFKLLIINVNTFSFLNVNCKCQFKHFFQVNLVKFKKDISKKVSGYFVKNSFDPALGFKCNFDTWQNFRNPEL